MSRRRKQVDRRVPTEAVDEVFVSVLPAYLRANGADEEAAVRAVLTGVAAYVDKHGGGVAGRRRAGERAEARAAVVAAVVAGRAGGGGGGGGEEDGGEAVAPILVRCAAHRPRAGWDVVEDDGDAEWAALRPSDYDELEASVLAGYMYHMEMEFVDAEHGGESPFCEDHDEKLETYLQFFAGNVFKPEYLAHLAAWYKTLGDRSKTKVITLLRRIQGALTGSPSLRPSFPWRSALFAAYVSEDVVARRAFEATQPAVGSFADLYTMSSSHAPPDAEPDDALDLTAQYEADGRPDSPVIAGLSTRKINLQQNDASSSRFDAHGQTTLTARQLDAMVAEGRKPEPARSVYAQSYEWSDAAAKRAFSTCYTKDLQRSVKLGLDREMRLETTYGADINKLGNRVLARNEELGIVPSYEVTEPSDEAYARMVAKRRW